MNQRIPTNIITGFLGVGKTTAILDLLANKPNDERWAVLVNEYGEVSIDAAILEGGAASDGITIREVAGGCVCCATAPYLQVALHLLLTEARPHRLIVETTDSAIRGNFWRSCAGQRIRIGSMCGRRLRSFRPMILPRRECCIIRYSANKSTWPTCWC